MEAVRVCSGANESPASPVRDPVARWRLTRHASIGVKPSEAPRGRCSIAAGPFAGLAGSSRGKSLLVSNCLLEPTSGSSAERDVPVA